MQVTSSVPEIITNILLPKVIIMTLFDTKNSDLRSYAPDELMRRRRERVRDRRLREGSMMTGRVLTPDKAGNIIELYPDSLPLAL